MDCPTPKQALWYFQDEVIAVPKDNRPVPSLVWIGAPDVLNEATLSPGDHTLLTADGSRLRFVLTSQLLTNRSYYDESTTNFFRKRSLRIRGNVTTQEGLPTVVARTIWPEDYRIEQDALIRQPLRPDETLASLIGEEKDGAERSFLTRLLWERHPGAPRRWAGQAVLGLLLSGAQGDDDDAHAGHFTVVTGRVGERGELATWMVNNFYNLDEESEKGVLPARVPMDNYLMDLNSGQAYYRPHYLLVAVLRKDRAAHRFQEAVEETYSQFYRHEFAYDNAAANCTGLSMDTLREIGWAIPQLGRTSYLMAIAAFLYLSVRDRSVVAGARIFDYHTEELTRLLPRVAFEVAGRDLLGILGRRPEPAQRPLTPYERILQEDVEAVMFIRVPQIPSSRVFGTSPVSTLDEYRRRMPTDRSQWKKIPLKPRPFPTALFRR
jgi:hypothetical protein